MLLAIYTVVTPFVIFIGKKMTLGREIDFIDPKTFFEFPSIWEFQGYIGQWMVFIFLGFLGVIFVSSEIRNKTMRQSLIAGMTRKDFYLSKVLSIASVSLWATIVYWFSCVVIGFFHTPEFSLEIVMNNDWAGLRFFLMSFCYLSFALLITFWFKNAGLAIFSYIAYILFEPAIRWLIYYKVIKKIDFIPNDAVLYGPLNVVEDLMPFPLFRIADAIPMEEIDFEFLLTYKTASYASLIFFGIFYLCSYLSFTRKDL